MKLQNFYLRALVSITDKTDRSYFNQIHVQSGNAYASNGVIAIRFPVSLIDQAITFQADKAKVIDMVDFYRRVEKDVQQELSFSLNQLLKLLKTIKKTSRSDTVTLKINRKNRPMIVESKPITGLIVPVRF